MLTTTVLVIHVFGVGCNTPVGPAEARRMAQAELAYRPCAPSSGSIEDRLARCGPNIGVVDWMPVHWIPKVYASGDRQDDSILRFTAWLGQYASARETLVWSFWSFDPETKQSSKSSVDASFGGSDFIIADINDMSSVTEISVYRTSDLWGVRDELVVYVLSMGPWPCSGIYSFTSRRESRDFLTDVCPMLADQEPLDTHVLVFELHIQSRNPPKPSYVRLGRGFYRPAPPGRELRPYDLIIVKPRRGLLEEPRFPDGVAYLAGEVLNPGPVHHDDLESGGKALLRDLAYSLATTTDIYDCTVLRGKRLRIQEVGPCFAMSCGEGDVVVFPPFDRGFAQFMKGLPPLKGRGPRSPTGQEGMSGAVPEDDALRGD